MQAMSPSGNAADTIYQVQGIHPVDGPYLASLVVNWGEAKQSMTYDPVLAGAAFSKYDVCEYTDLWTGEKTQGNGMAKTYDLEAHDHVAFRTKCSPW